MTGRACTACIHHSAEPVCGGVLHLCRVPEALPRELDENESPMDVEERDSVFLGWICDHARRMGELCGPAGNLWSPKA